MKTKRLWLGYSLLTIVFWSIWALLSKVASEAVPSATLQVLFTLGSTLVMVWLLLRLVRFVRSPATDQARPGSPSGHTDPGGDRKKTGGNH